MVIVNRARILLIRAGIIIAAFFGVALIWIVSEAILPESYLIGAIQGIVCVALFFVVWDFSMQLGEPGGSLIRAPKDDRSLSSSPPGEHEVDTTSARASDQSNDSKFIAEPEPTRDVLVHEDEELDFVPMDFESEEPDKELWAEVFTSAHGIKRRREAIQIRLKAKRLQKNRSRSNEGTAIN